jgi:DNA polymerase-3 subunit epsilon
MSRRPRTGAARRYRAARMPAPRTPWREAPFCVVDLETSGLDVRSDEIVSLAAVPVEHGRIRAGDAIYRLARPERPLAVESILVHRIRPADLEVAPPLAEALEPLLDAMAGRTLVAHAAWIERGFLSRALRPLGVRLRGPIVDTIDLARLLWALDGWAPPPPPSLGRLAGALGLPVHRPHHALGDGLTTAQAFLALATRLDAHGPQTVRTLARAREALAVARRFGTT